MNWEYGHGKHGPSSQYWECKEDPSNQRGAQKPYRSGWRNKRVHAANCHTPEAAIRCAYSAKSVGSRPSARLTPSRAAKCGVKRLALYIEFWGNYVPEIYSVSKALLLAQDTGECGWSTQQYVRWMKTLAERTFVKE